MSISRARLAVSVPRNRRSRSAAARQGDCGEGATALLCRRSIMPTAADARMCPQRMHGERAQLPERRSTAQTVSLRGRGQVAPPKRRTARLSSPRPRCARRARTGLRRRPFTKTSCVSRLASGLKYRTGVGTGYASYISSGHDGCRQTFG
jgi:hypothetical protein